MDVVIVCNSVLMLLVLDMDVQQAHIGLMLYCCCGTCWIFFSAFLGDQGDTCTECAAFGPPGLPGPPGPKGQQGNVSFYRILKRSPVNFSLKVPYHGKSFLHF